MAANGDLPKPDCAIFADTQWEPKAVYEWLGFLVESLPFPVYRVTAGNLRENTLARWNTTGQRFAAVPWFIKMPDGKVAMGRRQCTKEYKIRPIQKKIVELCDGERKKAEASLWIGISLDEATRMKPSQVKYIENKWPLIESRMTRNDCLRWLERHGYPKPPKSACIACPFHNDNGWRHIKADPASWQDAVEIDRTIRNQSGFKGEQFAHRSMIPLEEVDFSTAEENGQLNFFENECEGMCGT